MTNHLRLLFLLPIALQFGCGSRGADTGPMIRDSAGIRIVESTEPAWTTPWRLSSQPILTIGQLEGEPEYEFTRILGALRLGDGRVVIADATSMELRFFDNNGRFLHAAGGSGGGPGEFERLEAIARFANDSLFAYGRWRVSIFDHEGEFVRSFSVEPPDLYLPMKPLGRFTDGSFLTTQSGYPIGGWDGPTRIERPDQPVYRYSSTGASQAEFGSFPGWEFTVHRASRGSGFNRGRREFARSTAILAYEDRVFVGDNASYQIQVYTSDGRLQSLIRKRHEPVPVTDEEVDALRAPRLVNEERRQTMQHYFRGLPAPPQTMPAFGYQIQADRVGNLWVIEYERPSETQRRHWTVFDSEGRWLSTMRLPDGFDLMDVGEDWVLGRTRDEFDVEYVRLYRLIKDPTSLSEYRQKP